MTQRVVGGLPRPSKALIALLVTIGCLWVMFAVAINWGGAGVLVFELLAGDSAGLFRGEVWRLLSAPLMHTPNAPMHLFFSLLMLYFFVPALEERWGSKRAFMFLFACAAFAYALESLVHVLFPSVGHATWYGAMVMGDAALVAWAVQNRHRVINFMFVLPLKPLVMVGLMLVLHVFQIFARSVGPEGMVAPFGAALAGWLFCDSGPARRAYLRFRLRRLQSQVNGVSQQGKRPKRSASHLRVIKGGADDDDDKKMLH